MLLSFVIPCYGSESTIESVVDETIATVEQRGEYQFEIIIVNDASPDRALDLVVQRAAQDPRIKVIDLSRNFGQHSALMAGYSRAKGEVVVSLDDDGQTPASEVFKLIEGLGSGSDAVFARYPSKRHSFFRRVGSRVNDAMASYLIGKPKGLYLSSYFVARRFVIDEMLRYPNSFPYVTGLVLRTTSNVSNAEVSHRSRASGESGYTPMKLFSLWLNGFTAFSVKPLRVSAFVGAVFAVVGFAAGVYALINKLVNPHVPVGWSSLIALQAFVGGVLLIMLGMIGEYIGRIYIGVNRSPQYVVRRTFNVEE